MLEKQTLCIVCYCSVTQDFLQEREWQGACFVAAGWSKIVKMMGPGEVARESMERRAAWRMRRRLKRNASSSRETCRCFLGGAW